MINNRLVIAEDLVVILPVRAWLLPFVILYCIWSDRPEQTSVLSEDWCHELPQMQRLRVYTICHSSSYFRHNIDSKFYFSNFLIKYGKELRCMNAKGKYGKVTDTKIKWLIICKSVTIIIFVEFIDQLIYYPINCASLTVYPKWF